MLYGFPLNPVGHETRGMTEWLVQRQPDLRFQRVIAGDLETILDRLDTSTEATVFSIKARAYRITNGCAFETRARLPFDTHLAWWHARHPRAVMASRVVVAVASAALLIAKQSGVHLSPVVLLLAGASGIAAWWGWELEHSRLEPKVVRLIPDA